MLLVTASLGRVRFPPPAPPPRVFGNFVELRGGALFLDGKPFHFVGTNIYWLMTRAAPSAELFDRTTAALGQLTGAPQWAAALVLVGATFCGSTMVLATLASRCLRCVAGARHRWLHIVDEPPSAAEL